MRLQKLLRFGESQVRKPNHSPSEGSCRVFRKGSAATRINVDTKHQRIKLYEGHRRTKYGEEHHQVGAKVVFESENDVADPTWEGKTLNPNEERTSGLVKSLRSRTQWKASGADSDTEILDTFRGLLGRTWAIAKTVLSIQDVIADIYPVDPFLIDQGHSFEFHRSRKSYELWVSRN